MVETQATLNLKPHLTVELAQRGLHLVHVGPAPRYEVAASAAAGCVPGKLRCRPPGRGANVRGRRGRHRGRRRQGQAGEGRRRRRGGPARPGPRRGGGVVGVVAAAAGRLGCSERVHWVSTQ